MLMRPNIVMNLNKIQTIHNNSRINNTPTNNNRGNTQNPLNSNINNPSIMRISIKMRLACMICLHTTQTCILDMVMGMVNLSNNLLLIKTHSLPLHKINNSSKLTKRGSGSSLYPISSIVSTGTAQTILTFRINLLGTLTAREERINPPIRVSMIQS